MGTWKTARVSTLVFAAVSLSISAGPAATALAATAPTRQSAIDPQARDALTRMSAAVKSLPEFSVRGDITHEQVINGDLKVQKSSSADTLVRRPDHLKSDVIGDDEKSHTLFFDGKTLTLYTPARKYYAQVDAPGTIGAAVDKAQSSYGVDLPVSDFLRMADDDFAKGLTAAGDVGKSRVGNADCEHYAYRKADVDYQLWIDAGDKPLPRKLVITSKKEPTQPEYTAILTWDLSPKIDAAAFAFTPPEGATEIPFGAPPPRQSKHTKAQVAPPKN
jgi:hypothetical protein